MVISGVTMPLRTMFSLMRLGGLTIRREAQSGARLRSLQAPHYLCDHVGVQRIVYLRLS